MTAAETKSLRRAEEKVRGLEQQRQKFESAAAIAGRKLDAAQADEAEHGKSLEAARDAYAANPSSSSAKLVNKRRDAFELAQLRTRKPRDAKKAADDALTTWRAALAGAESELAGAREAMRVAELRQRVTVADFETLTAPAYGRLAVALAAVNAAVAEIDGAFADANAAAAALSEAGEPTLPLAEFHLIAPFVRARVDANPATAAALLASLQQLGLQCSTGGWSSPLKVGLSNVFVSPPLLAEIGKCPGFDDENTQARREQLDAALASRTRAEADAAVATLRRAAAPVVEEEPVETPAPAAAPASEDDADEPSGLVVRTVNMFQKLRPAPAAHDTSHFDRLAAEQNAPGVTEARR